MRIIKNGENNYSNVSPNVSSCYHDHIQGHQVVINYAAKEFQQCCKENDPKNFENPGQGPWKKQGPGQLAQIFALRSEEVDGARQAEYWELV